MVSEVLFVALFLLFVVLAGRQHLKMDCRLTELHHALRHSSRAPLDEVLDTARKAMMALDAQRHKEQQR